MRRSIFATLAVLMLAGCGGASQKPPPAAPVQHLTAAPVGCMGPCLPTLKLGAPPKAGAQRPRLPDVSEWQPCVSRAVPTVFRLAYGSRQDTTAACNGRYLAAHHVWRAGYVYLLPGSCTAQASAGARIARAVGVELVIADGEEPLGQGFQRCFLTRVHQLTGLPAADYTGCFSGLERIQPLWVPSYGAPPACGPFKAWQYTDGTYCGEPYVTDCSFDYGITAQPPTPKPPAPKPQPHAARIAYLRSLARKHGCYRHGRKPHACAVWAREVRALQA